MKLLRIAAALLVLAAACPPALAQGQSVAQQLQQLRLATAPYHAIDVARAAGWDQDITGCLESPEGGMGHHYMNDSNFTDATIEALRPELLVYAPTADGSLRLVALEYLVFADALGSDPVPQLFGQHFHLNPAINAYVLHVWLWEQNPRGMFADWNPRVNCP